MDIDNFVELEDVRFLYAEGVVIDASWLAASASRRGFACGYAAVSALDKKF
jgi:hypothetical protein